MMRNVFAGRYDVDGHKKCIACFILFRPRISVMVATLPWD